MIQKSVQKIVWVSFTAASVFCLILYNMADNYVHDFLALLLSTFSGIYLLPAMMQTELKPLIAEIVFFILIFSLAMAGLYISIIITGIGFLLMNLWNVSRCFWGTGVKIQKSFRAGLLTVNTVLTFYIIFFLIF